MRHEEHVVDAKAQRQEGQHLRRGGVEGQPEQGAQPEAGGDGDGNQEDAREAETRRRSHRIRQLGERQASVNHLSGGMVEAY